MLQLAILALTFILSVTNKIATSIHSLPQRIVSIFAMEEILELIVAIVCWIASIGFMLSRLLVIVWVHLTIKILKFQVRCAFTVLSVSVCLTIKILAFQVRCAFAVLTVSLHTANCILAWLHLTPVIPTEVVANLFGNQAVDLVDMSSNINPVVPDAHPTDDILSAAETEATVDPVVVDGQPVENIIQAVNVVQVVNIVHHNSATTATTASAVEIAATGALVPFERDVEIGTSFDDGGCISGWRFIACF